MTQDIAARTENVKEKLKQRGKVVLKWVLAITYLVLLIYFVLIPLMEFLVMCENYMRIYILNYLIKHIL